jgi:hypothetical protein
VGHTDAALRPFLGQLGQLGPARNPVKLSATPDISPNPLTTWLFLGLPCLCKVSTQRSAGTGPRDGFDLAAVGISEAPFRRQRWSRKSGCNWKMSWDACNHVIFRSSKFSSGLAKKTEQRTRAEATTRREYTMAGLQTRIYAKYLESSPPGVVSGLNSYSRINWLAPCRLRAKGVISPDIRRWQGWVRPSLHL